MTPPKWPEMKASDPGEWVAGLTDYYFRTTPAGVRLGPIVTDEAAAAAGVYRQGNFIFPNLCVPALLGPLFRAFDDLDEMVKGITRADNIAKVLKWSPWWAAAGFLDPTPGAAEGLLLEHKRWLDRKEGYRSRLVTSNPWQPPDHVEVSDPLFLGWYPPGSEKDRGVQSVPDIATPLILARALGLSAELWKKRVAEVGPDMIEQVQKLNPNNPNAPDGALAKLLKWMLGNPGKVAGGLVTVGVVGGAVVLRNSPAGRAVRGVIGGGE